MTIIVTHVHAAITMEIKLKLIKIKLIISYKYQIMG